MSDKEIVLCNFDEPTTQVYLDKFESFFCDQINKNDDSDEEICDDEDSEEEKLESFKKSKSWLMSRRQEKEEKPFFKDRKEC
jgi:hypothetical protein